MSRQSKHNPFGEKVHIYAEALDHVTDSIAQTFRKHATGMVDARYYHFLMDRVERATKTERKGTGTVKGSTTKLTWATSQLWTAFRKGTGNPFKVVQPEA
eukprot:COSAG01_NODE_27810_length_676_cov_1.268631_1_plen_100_part_00